MTSRSLGGGVQGFCDDRTKALVMKRVTDDWGRGGSKIIQNCVTSFMDDPQGKLVKKHKARCIMVYLRAYIG